MKMKIKIPPARALLIILEQEIDPQNRDKLKSLFLRGGLDLPEVFKQYSDRLKGVEIDFSDKAINNDPVRRYFESHLALQTLLACINRLSSPLLEVLHDAVVAGLGSTAKVEHKNDMMPAATNEYSDAILRIQSSQKTITKMPSSGEGYEAFDKKSCKKLLVIWNLIHASVLLTQESRDIPLQDVYESPPFTDDTRGRILKTPNKDEGPPFSSLAGLMHSKHPIPREDPLLPLRHFFFKKSSDGCRYDKEAQYIKELFTHGVHPFSASISATYLALLRSLAALYAVKKLPIMTLEDFTLLSLCAMSAMLYHGGGHSYYEFISVVQLPAIKKYFSNIFNEFSQLDMWQALQTNQTAFDAAFAQTRSYNAILLKHELMMKDILTRQEEQRMSLPTPQSPPQIVISSDEQAILAEQIKKLNTKYAERMNPRTCTGASNSQADFLWRIKVALYKLKMGNSCQIAILDDLFEQAQDETHDINKTMTGVFKLRPSDLLIEKDNGKITETRQIIDQVFEAVMPVLCASKKCQAPYGSKLRSLR